MPQIPSEVLSCVGFLSPGEHETPDGTVFFVSIHADDPHHRGPVSAVYAVTAKHLLERYEVESGSDKAWLRLNRKGGGVVSFPTKTEDWRRHPDADVAIHTWPLEHSFDIAPFPARLHLIDDIIVEWNITPGDEVFLSGLFWQHAGETRNAPIVRLGSIAAMRGDRIYTTNYGAMDAYLIEVRSVGGLSGSPVFFNGEGRRKIRVPAVGIGGRQLPSRIERRAETSGFFLLGLVHGHYHAHAMRVDGVEDVINSGIAIAVPADKILELILGLQGVDKSRLDK